MSDQRKSHPEIEAQSSEALGDREMMSVLSGSSASLVPPTTDGVGAAESASGTAAGSSLTTDEASSYVDSDAEGSSSEPVATSEEDATHSFSQSDSAEATS